jgi:hypothetical protein
MHVGHAGHGTVGHARVKWRAMQVDPGVGSAPDVAVPTLPQVPAGGPFRNDSLPSCLRAEVEGTAPAPRSRARRG